MNNARLKEIIKYLENPDETYKGKYAYCIKIHKIARPKGMCKRIWRTHILSDEWDNEDNIDDDNIHIDGKSGGWLVLDEVVLKNIENLLAEEELSEDDIFDLYNSVKKLESTRNRIIETYTNDCLQYNTPSSCYQCENSCE